MQILLSFLAALALALVLAIAIACGASRSEPMAATEPTASPLDAGATASILASDAAKQATREIQSQKTHTERSPWSSGSGATKTQCVLQPRGKRSRNHALLGRDASDVGGSMLCKRGDQQGGVWQIRIGTLCNDIRMWHERVTVELKGGKVVKAWSLKVHNSAFCQ